MQTERLPYLMLYELYHRLLQSLNRPLVTPFVIPVPVGWSLSSLHVQGPVNRRG
ncbi:hypothetical protein [Pseudaeromonas sharmana]|uniref:hypothetical protein n=1 Tax=Pseudaeromonas sharmana TaxID=328412 RepID=UPI00366C8844